MKADRWVIQAVSNAVDRSVTPSRAREVVMGTARALDRDPTALEHALWAFERRRTAR